VRSESPLSPQLIDSNIVPQDKNELLQNSEASVKTLITLVNNQVEETFTLFFRSSLPY
jgi:hypothetical protein